MNEKCVMGLIPNALIDTALNNLYEAGFDDATISVITNDIKTSRAIADDSGLLEGVTVDHLEEKLVSLGVTTSQANVYASGVKEGEIFVIVATPLSSSDAAEEILADAGGYSIMQL